MKKSERGIYKTTKIRERNEGCQQSQMQQGRSKSAFGEVREALPLSWMTPLMTRTEKKVRRIHEPKVRETLKMKK